MHSPSSCTFTLFYACAVQFIGTFVQWSRYMLRACCKRVFVVPLSLIMDNFWFYLSYLYLQCTWMYVLSFPASERFEFAKIGMAWVDLLCVHVCLHCPELRFMKNADRAKSLYMWDFIVLYRIPRDFTRLLAYFFICRDSLRRLQ